MVSAVSAESALENDADGEEHRDDGAQRARSREHRQQFVASRRQRCALLLRQHHKQHAERHEQQVGGHEGETIRTHILLSLA